MIATEGGPFHDADADEALFTALRDGLGDNVECMSSSSTSNDPAFADAMADRLHEMVSAAG